MARAVPALDAVLARLTARAVSTTAWWARCPVHDEHSPSLSIRVAPGTPPYALHCFGCGAGTKAVLAALGFEDATPAPSDRPFPDEGTPAWWAEVRKSALRMARAQAWAREDTRLLMAAADLHRAMLHTIASLQAASTRLGPDDPAAWKLEEWAAHWEHERRLLEVAMDATA